MATFQVYLKVRVDVGGVDTTEKAAKVAQYKVFETLTNTDLDDQEREILVLFDSAEVTETVKAER